MWRAGIRNRLLQLVCLRSYLDSITGIPDSMGDRWNLNFMRKCIRINKTRSKFRIFKRFEIDMTHLVSLLRLLSSVRIRLLLELLRSRFGEVLISSHTDQYNSKSKTRQNGFVMALERTADNKRNNADYMRNNLSHFSRFQISSY